MRIAYITADWGSVDNEENPDEPFMVLGGSGYWRAGIPAVALRDYGKHTVTVVPTIGSLKTGEICPVGWDDELDTTGYDVIVLQRWMHQDGAGVIRRAQSCGQIVVNDCDDYFDGLDMRNAAYWHTDPRTNPESNRLHYKKILAASDAVTVSTPFLQEKIGAYANTYLLRNRIDMDRWDAYRAQRVAPETPTLGWVGSTPWRSGDLETLTGIVGPFLDRFGWQFAHHGHYGDEVPNAGQLMGLEQRQMLEPWGMLPITEYPTLFNEISLGIVPLNMIGFNYAKSAIKGIEYAAAGIPFVAQATPEYQWFDKASACRKPRDWVKRLNLLGDETFRKEEAARQLELAKAQDIALHWRDWEHLYESLLKGLPAQATLSS